MSDEQVIGLIVKIHKCGEPLTISDWLVCLNTAYRAKWYFLWRFTQKKLHYSLFSVNLHRK